MSNLLNRLKLISLFCKNLLCFKFKKFIQKLKKKFINSKTYYILYVYCFNNNIILLMLLLQNTYYILKYKYELFSFCFCT